MEIDEPPTDETELPYFAGIACVENGEYERSDSLPAWTFVVNKLLGKELL